MLAKLAIECAATFVGVALYAQWRAPELFLVVPEVGWRLWAVSGRPLPPCSAQDARWGPSPFDKELFSKWLRDGDVVVSSCPRCGGHWLRYILHLLRSNGSAPAEDLNNVVPYLGWRSLPGEDWKQHLLAQRHHWDNRSFPHRVFKAYPPSAPLTSHWRDLDTLDIDTTVVRQFTKIKYVVLARSGPDMISSLRYYWSQHDSTCRTSWGGFPPRNMTHVELIELLGQMPHMYWDWIKAWWRLRLDPNVLLLHYTDLIYDLPDQLHRVAAFLNLSISNDAFQLVVSRTDFQHMKREDTTFQYGRPGRACDEFSAEAWRAWFHSERKHLSDSDILQWLRLGSTKLRMPSHCKNSDKSQTEHDIASPMSIEATAECTNKAKAVLLQVASQTQGVILQVAPQTQRAWEASLGPIFLSHFKQSRKVLDTVAASWPNSLTAGVIFIVSATSSAAIGFGGAVIFQALWCIAGLLGSCDGDGLTATMILVVTNYFADMTMCIVLRKHTSWSCLGWSLPAILVGHGLGIGLVVVVSNIMHYKACFALAVSSMLLLVALCQMPRIAPAIRRRVAGLLHDPSNHVALASSPCRGTPSKNGVLWSTCTASFAVALVLCRFFQGLFSGSTGMGGWPPMVFVLKFNPAKDEFRATQATMLTGLALMTLPVLAILGILAPLEQWPLLLCCFVGQAVGTIIGYNIRVEQENWLAVMVFFVFTVALTAGTKALFSLDVAAKWAGR